MIIGDRSPDRCRTVRPRAASAVVGGFVELALRDVRVAEGAVTTAISAARAAAAVILLREDEEAVLEIEVARFQRRRAVHVRCFPVRGAADLCGGAIRRGSDRPATRTKALVMRRLSACAALAGTALLAGVVSAAPAPSGSVYVTTLPGGADVYVDGTFVGRSPVLVDGLGPGRHGLTMTKAGWTLRETSIVVTGGALAFENDRLLAAGASGATGSIVLRGVADGTPVQLDGAAVASHGTLVTTVGPHHLSIGSGDGRTTRTIVVYPETTTTVLARDAAPAATHGAAAVVAPLDEWLPDAVVTLAGKKLNVRYEGHVLDGRLGESAMHVDGEPVSYEASPETIGGKIYLPLGLLERLSGTVVSPRPKK